MLKRLSEVTLTNLCKWGLTNFDASTLWVRDRTNLTDALDITPEFLRTKHGDEGKFCCQKFFSQTQTFIFHNRHSNRLSQLAFRPGSPFQVTQALVCPSWVRCKRGSRIHTSGKYFPSSSPNQWYNLVLTTRKLA